MEDACVPVTVTILLAQYLHFAHMCSNLVLLDPFTCKILK